MSNSNRALMGGAALLGFCFVGGLAAAPGSFQGTDPEPRGGLTFGATESGSLEAGAVHSWSLELRSGEFCRLELDQSGLDLIARVIGPGGEPVGGFDFQRDASVSETVAFIPEADGTHRLEVLGASADDAGDYSIQWTTRRSATEADRRLAEAYSAHYRARGLIHQNQPEAAQEPAERSIRLFEQVLPPEDPLSARAAELLAYAHWDARDLERAEPWLLKTLQIREASLGLAHPRVADTHEDLGDLYWNRWQLEKAEASFRKTMAIREKQGDPVQLVRALDDLATVLVDRGDHAGAEPLYLRALEIGEARSDRRLANVLNNLGNLYRDQARYDDAEAAYGRALEIFRRDQGENHANVAMMLNNLGNLAGDRGNYSQAVSMHERALEIRKQAYGALHPSVASSLDSLALANQELGRFREAESLYRQALEILEKADRGQDPQAGWVTMKLANLLSVQGRFRDAEPLYRKTLGIMRGVFGAEHVNTGYVLEGLATLHNKQGDFDEAEPLHRQAAAIFEAALGPEHPALAGALNNLAILKRHQGRYDEAALLYDRVLEITGKVQGTKHERYASALTNLGNLHFDQGQFEDAERIHRQAMEVLESALGPDHLSVSESLNSLGELYRVQRRWEEAERSHLRALEIREKALLPGHPDIAESLLNLAKVHWDRGDAVKAAPLLDRSVDLFDASRAYPELRIDAHALRARVRRRLEDRRGALEDLEEALNSAEELRPQIGGDEETRASFFHRYADYYDLMVSWQLDAGEDDEALEYAERGRARVLLDQLAAGKIDLRSGIPEALRVGLESRESEAKLKLAEYQRQLTRLRSADDLPDTERGRRLVEMSAAARLAEQEFRQVYADIKNASPLWRDLITSGGRPVAMSAIQRRVAPEDGLVLLYQIGDEESHLFVIPPSGSEPQVTELRVEEGAAEILKLEPGPLTNAKLDKALTGAPKPEEDDRSLSFAWGLTQPRYRTSVRDFRRLHALFEVLAPAPVRERIMKASRVLLIPDGALNLLPLEALVVEPPEDAAQPVFWLDRGPALLYAASATSLYSILRRPSDRAYAQRGVLSLADPIYDLDQVAAAARGEAEAEQPAAEAPPPQGRDLAEARNRYERAGGALLRLPGTALETEAIKNALGESAEAGLVELSRLAATEAALRRAIEGKRYLHLATHGLVGVGDRSLFSALALTPPADEAPDSANDGYLQLHEIYELQLPECELAVLSACQTNIGRSIEGEGVFALSRGFLAAGAQRVVASQWAVDDASTAALIGAFFGRIVQQERAGEPVDYARALRDAKRAVRNQEKWSAPYFWAPFILTGKP